MSEQKIRSLGGSGILTGDDLADFNAAETRVGELMADGEWHGAEEIKLAAGRDGIPASEGLRRMRALKPKLAEKGCEIERERSQDGRSFSYRVIRTQPPTGQTTLF